MTKQEKYLKYIADRNYSNFFQQGFATPGNNGPHGHFDTPVRNTSHYLIIYGYLYKETNEKKYLDICYAFADYLCEMQKKSESGAVQCMVNNDFDYLNGLIGQAWVIEALIYFYKIVSIDKYLDVASEIFFSQKYNYKLHLWERIELDGENIGVDYTYNHNVWFAAVGSILSDFKKNVEIDNQIIDFLNNGTIRDFQINHNGLLKHTISLKNRSKKVIIKQIIKTVFAPIKFINRRKLDKHYIEYAYHIFDIYAFEILKEKYHYLNFFSSSKYIKAEKLACDIDWYNKKNINKNGFNVFSYSYNSPAFELPYVLLSAEKMKDDLVDYTFDINKKLMYSEETKMFTIDNYDVELFNARCYEIIRFLERINT